MSDQPIDAEVVPQQQAVAVRPTSGGMATISDLEQAFALAVRQRDLLSDYIKKQLVPNKHFYAREGQKPSLTKEGAEIILLPHGLVPDYDQTSGPNEPPDGGKPYQITVKCTLRHKGDPNSFVGSGIGSAGSHHGFWNKQTRAWEYKPRQPDRYLCHNATLKMAQKSAMIAATINSTAASEFFTQDMDPTPPGPQDEPQLPIPPSGSAPTPPTPPTPQSAPGTATPEECRAKFSKNMDKEGLRQLASQFLIDLSWMLPTETLETMELRYVPINKEQYIAFIAKLTNYGVTGKAEKPYEPREIPKAATAAKTEPAKAPKDDEWWRDIIIPMPRKGMKKADYDKHPDTIGSLYELRHGSDDEADEARKRLWWLAKEWEPKSREFKGKIYEPTAADHKCREALDAFCDWWEKNHPEEKL